jgi:glycosyltransferase involved in cell wall biosynthesis
MTDTQGLVVNEAAHFGLPIVLCDADVTDVAVDGENGLVARNDPTDFAEKVAQILADDQLRTRFGQRSRESAAGLTEQTQTEKAIALFREILSSNAKPRQ